MRIDAEQARLLSQQAGLLRLVVFLLAGMGMFAPAAAGETTPVRVLLAVYALLALVALLVPERFGRLVWADAAVATVALVLARNWSVLALLVVFASYSVALWLAGRVALLAVAALVAAGLARASYDLLVAGRAEWPVLAVLPAMWLAGWLGWWQRSQMDERAFLARMVSALQFERGLAESLRLALNELMEFFRCQEAVLAVYDRSLERVFYWRVPAQFTGRLQPQGAPATRRDAFLLHDLHVHLGWNQMEGPGDGFGWHRQTRQRLRELPRLPSPSRQALAARSLLAVTLEFEGEPAARLLLLNGRQRFHPGDLRRLERAARALQVPLENLYRLRHLRARAVEAERSRISLDLHDGVLQTLLSVEIQLGVLQRKLRENPEVAAAELASVLETLRSGREELRQMVTDLRPLGVESADLVDLMRGYAERFRNETGIGLDLLIQGPPPTLSDRLCRELFQIYREALANIKKHAGATHVVVKLFQNETMAYLVVDDNGKGFSFA
ncbi:MAG: hypothetical protein K6U02_03910, partial [Firmicutes bacterium]|nr:hypothetical protein [Bacillota bacterium]